VSPRGVVTRKKANNSSGLNLVEGHKFCPGTQTRSGDDVSWFLGVTEALPFGPVVVGEPATKPLL